MSRAVFAPCASDCASSGVFSLLQDLEPRKLMSTTVPQPDVVLAWNGIMLDANAADHALAAPDQGGPTKTSRAFALESIAVFDALNAIRHKYQGMVAEPRGFEAADDRAAVSQAAHDTLVALFPQQQARFDAALSQWLAVVPDGSGETLGRQLGAQVAAAVLANRANDGSAAMMMYTPTPGPGHHMADPNNPSQGYLGPMWGDVTPFSINNVNDFIPVALPALTSAQYTAAYTEVKQFGGDGVTTPTVRTVDQTRAGLFWAYDGSPGLGTPPRLYNQIAVQIGEQRGNDPERNARLLGMVNVAMADAGVTCWAGKYQYDFWRPIVGIRFGDTDGNAATIEDPAWNPLGAPLSNGNGAQNNFTPPFPAYASGHATFGAAMFQTLATFYSTRKLKFTFVSDELNGVTTDNLGNARPLAPRTFRNVDEAIVENAQSRIYLGIHWSFDATEGIRCGKLVSDYVTSHAFLPKRSFRAENANPEILPRATAKPVEMPANDRNTDLQELFSAAVIV